MPQIIVPGAAAGGGFPQWNCNFGNYPLAWQEADRFVPRTRSSPEAMADGERWLQS
jgi:pyrroloquinoline quinone biosynthesis protein B